EWQRRALFVSSGLSSLMVAFGLPRVSSTEGGGIISRVLFGIGGYIILFSLGVFATWAVWGLVARTDNDWVGPALVGFFRFTLAFPLWIGSDRGTLLNTLSLSGVYEDRLQQTWIIGARPRITDPNEATSRTPDSVARWHSVWTRPDLTVSQLRGNG